MADHHIKDYCSPAATFSGHTDADLANMGTTREILKRSNDLIPPRPKLLLHRNRQPPSHNKPRDLLQVLLRADHDAPHDRPLRKSKRRNVRHLVLGARREEPDDGDAAAVRQRGYALRDGPRAAVFEDEVGAAAVRDALDLLGPVGRRLVVDGEVGAVGGLDVLEFCVRGGSDYGGRAGCFGED